MTLHAPCRDSTTRLFHEFRRSFTEDEVRQVVADCMRDLSGVPTGAIPELAERSARQRLATALAGPSAPRLTCRQREAGAWAPGR